MKTLPADFLAQLPSILPPQEISPFIDALQQEVTTSVRLHPHKPLPKAHFAATKPVSWCVAGRYLPTRPSFTLDPCFWAGAYYVQEASSMLVAESLAQLPLAAGAVVLDLCAAPGGKSTHIHTILPEQSLLVSNEIIKTRVGILQENLTRWGYAAQALTSTDAAEFGEMLPEFFHAIVVDAPCSGEGLFRKDEKARDEWSLEHVRLCSARQRRILADVLPALRPHGYLVYSTCTYNRSENEDNVAWLMAQGYQSVRLDWSNIPDIVEVNEHAHGQDLWAYRALPHRTMGEGFFLAILQKTTAQPHLRVSRAYRPILKPAPRKQVPTEIPHWLTGADGYTYYTGKHEELQALPTATARTVEQLSLGVALRQVGLPLGRLKGKDFIPAPALALAVGSSSSLPSLTLTYDDALRYLRKQDVEIAPQTPKGWILVRYAGLGLGWLKVMQGRVNNYYPAEWRIRKVEEQ